MPACLAKPFFDCRQFPTYAPGRGVIHHTNKQPGGSDELLGIIARAMHIRTAGVKDPNGLWDASRCQNSN